MTDEAVKLVVVGSIGIDTIETPFDKREEILGGSASYACAAAALFTSTGMVGVVGDDFPPAYEQAYRDFGIDLAGLQKQAGKTFRWSGVYLQNMDERETLSTDLNVFADFSPDLPQAYRTAPFLFLANIDPVLQHHVLDQMDAPAFVAMDTMDLWINIRKEDLIAVIGRVDLLTVNESEARHLTGEHFLPVAAEKLLELGPKFVLIKKGEHGSMLFAQDSTFALPAFPLSRVEDPTGAGDAFAGGFIGALAASGDVSIDGLRKAMIQGSVIASFAVEAFSLDRLTRLNPEEVRERTTAYREIVRIP